MRRKIWEIFCQFPVLGLVKKVNEAVLDCRATQFCGSENFSVGSFWKLRALRPRATLASESEDWYYDPIMADDDNPNAWFLFMAMARLLFSVACETRDWLTFWSPSLIVCELALTYYFARESFTAKLTSITKRTRVIELKNIFARPSLEFSKYPDFSTPNWTSLLSTVDCARPFDFFCSNWWLIREFAPNLQIFNSQI